MNRERPREIADDDPDVSFVTKLRELKKRLDRTYNTCDRAVIQARINRLIEWWDREI